MKVYSGNEKVKRWTITIIQIVRVKNKQTKGAKYIGYHGRKAMLSEKVYNKRCKDEICRRPSSQRFVG